MADRDDLLQDASLEALRALRCHDPSLSNPRTWVKKRLHWWALERRRTLARQPAWCRVVLPCQDLAGREMDPLDLIIYQELLARPRTVRTKRVRAKGKSHIRKPKPVHSCGRCFLPAGIVTFSPKGKGLAGYCKRCRCELHQLKRLG